MSWGSEKSPPSLVPGEVHVIAASLDELPSAARRAWLSADEVARAERFHFPRDRHRFAAGRGLLRGLLGRYLGLDPAELRFVYGPRGKPGLGPEARDLRFNVSHSGGLALLAFVRGRHLGVDLERERPLPEAEEMAGRFFSPRESAELRRLPGADRPRAFFRCWTRKEAFIKATGEGLSRPLDAFDVTLAPGEPARLLRVEGEPGDPGRWWLRDLELAAGFAGALAVEGPPLRVACWNWDSAVEEIYGQGREGRQGDLQGGREPRRAVLDLAG